MEMVRVSTVQSFTMKGSLKTFEDFVIQLGDSWTASTGEMLSWKKVIETGDYIAWEVFVTRDPNKRATLEAHKVSSKKTKVILKDGNSLFPRGSLN